MSGALWLLLRLQMVGWLRVLGKNVRSVRGALLALVGFLVFVPWILAMVFGSSGGGGIPADQMRIYGPAVLLLYCLLNVFLSTSERAIYFSPAEVQFLFTGPFSRRQLLAYKLFTTLLVSVPATLFLGIGVRVRQGWWPASILGLFLITVFMQLFALVLGLIVSSVGEHLISRSRRVLLVVFALFTGFLLWQADAFTSLTPESMVAVLETPAWQTLSWPLASFFEVMQAQSWAELLVPLAIGLGVNLLLIAIIFALDAHYLEASASASARIYARIQRMRGANVSVEGDRPAKDSRFTLPDFPYWGGVGPIFWRQIVVGLRGSSRVGLILVIVAGASLIPMFSSKLRTTSALMPALIGAGIWMAIFLPSIMLFDFRGDIDRMATLKTLPIVPWRLTLGQLLAPALLLSCIEWILLLPLAILLPQHLVLLAVAAAYVFPSCFFLMALENLLFLLFPVRMMAATPGDFQAIGRNVLLTMGKFFSLALLGGISAGIGIVVYIATRQVWLASLAGIPILVLACVLLIPLVSLAFQRFDVGRDTPA